MDGVDEAVLIPGPAADQPAKATKGEDDGHRDRLRQRFLSAGPEGVADYELLELILFRALPRRDVKPLAKAILKHFGSLAEALAASPERLRAAKIAGLSTATITEFGIVVAAAQQLLKGQIGSKPVLSSFPAVIDYCRVKMAFLDHEEVRVLFLNKRNQLIRDEQMGEGTVDHAPVYAREVIKKALELGATALVLVHNHPSGDTTPSQADISMTQQIVALSRPMGIEVHDHLIVGRNGHTSLRQSRLM